LKSNLPKNGSVDLVTKLLAIAIVVTLIFSVGVQCGMSQQRAREAQRTEAR
jgi:hypothetical protein